MMKKRILAIVLTSALILSLTACGGKNGSAPSDPDSGSPSGTGNFVPDGPATPDGPSISDVYQPNVSQPDTPQPDASLPDGSGVGTSEPDPGSGSGASDPAGADMKLTLNRTSIELNKAGATFKLRYTVDPDIYDGLAAFTSSNTKVATVDEIDGTIKAVAPGKATITVKYDGVTATASVNCNWKEAPSKPDTSKPADSTPGVPSIVPPIVDPSTSTGDPSASTGDPSASTGNPPESTGSPSETANVDLSAFYSAITGKYTFAMPMLADDGILDNFYSGMTGISTEQRLIYVCGMTPNNGEFGLVQVTDSADVEAVKSIFRARINYMVGDGNGPGGAWYPQAMDSWENNSRVVSNGNYVMMVVHENCDDIVKEFNALF